MHYETVKVFDNDGKNFIGYAIRKSGLLKLESVNLYDAAEFEDISNQVASLNEATALRQFWPSLSDPEVENLLADPDFESVEYEEVETIDLSKSELKYIWEEEPIYDVSGYLVREGLPKQGTDGAPVIDYRLSNIVTTVSSVPKQTDVRGRIDAACEIVARKRMNDAQ